MTRAKFLPFAALCLGLATFVSSIRAAQPVSDYDLEPLMRRYGEPNQNVTAEDENTAPETLQPIDRHPATKPAGSGVNQVSPAIFSSTENNSAQANGQDTQPTQTNTTSVRTSPRNVTAVPSSANNYYVKPAMATTAASDADGNPNGYPQTPYAQTPANSYTRSVQSARSSPNVSMNNFANFGDSSSGNAAAAPDNSSQTGGEMIGPGLEEGGCESCDNGCCGLCFNPCGNCGWYGGADYILARPDFSTAQAFVKIVGSGTTTVNETDTMIQQKFDYQSSVRAFIGYHTACGEDIRFTYWNFNNGGTLETPAPTDTTVFGGQFMTRANEPDQRLINTVGLNMNVYDIDYSRCCCNPCGSCGCNNCCPVWTLRYSAGIRIADVRRVDNTFSINPPVEDEPPPAEALVSASFIGAGPRVGLEGRRYFRSFDRLSLFARANFALMLGEVDLKQTLIVTSSDISPTTTETQTDSHDRIIPEADIEIGGDWQITNCLRLSAGYLFQAWWDLGEFEQISNTDFVHIDSSNIMGFDGLFARFEYDF
jgi:hypothetical protein